MGATDNMSVVPSFFVQIDKKSKKGETFYDKNSSNVWFIGIQ